MASEGRLDHIAFAVPDVQAALNEAESKGEIKLAEVLGHREILTENFACQLGQWTNQLSIANQITRLRKKALN